MASQKTVVVVRIVGGNPIDKNADFDEETAVLIPEEKTVRILQAPKQQNDECIVEARDYHFDYVYYQSTMEEGSEQNYLMEHVGNVPMLRCLAGEPSLIFAYGGGGTDDSAGALQSKLS